MKGCAHGQQSVAAAESQPSHQQVDAQQSIASDNQSQDIRITTMGVSFV